MKSLITLTAILLATNVGHADGLQGVWQSTGEECQSGAPSKGMGEHLVSAIDANANFTADQMRVNMQISYKYEKGYAEEMLKQLKNALAQWAQLPDSPDKQKSVADIKKSVDSITNVLNGVKCSIDEVRSYSVNGSTIQSQTISAVSNCPGFESALNERNRDESEFVMKDNILKILSPKAETSESGSCPKGDHSIFVFKRIK